MIGWTAGGAAGAQECELHYENHDIEDVVRRWDDLVAQDQWPALESALGEIIAELNSSPEDAADGDEADAARGKRGRMGRGLGAHVTYGKAVVPVLLAHKISVRKAVLLAAYQALHDSGALPERCERLERLLVTKASKSGSGVLVITVLTSPRPTVNGRAQRFSCEWNCHYCPAQPGQPRSYLRDEPAVLRANQNGFDPVLQFMDRARVLAQNGHPLDKVELLVLGGTWASYPAEYQEAFVRDLFYAANTVWARGDARRPRRSLAEEQDANETAACKIIGLTLETRPDCIDFAELRRLRRFGCTRVQLGVQHTDDAILEKINRGCRTADTKRALRLLTNSCFKVDIHLMPNLPGSDVVRDEAMFDEVLGNEDLQADQWKIYPCETTPWTVIKRWYDEGSYKPYAEEDLMELLMRVKARVHPWIRLNRVVRDIPVQYVLGGMENPSLRQVLAERMRKRGQRCRCIRCREIGLGQHPGEVELVEREFASHGGTEVFISFEAKDRSVILGFARLRLNSASALGPERVADVPPRQADMELQDRPSRRRRARSKSPAPRSASDEPARRGSLSPFAELDGAALVRELHVYGQLLATSDAEGGSNAQHRGLGGRLMRRAEEIARDRGARRVAVIAGIGVRNFYRRLGYRLEPGEGRMMIKSLGRGRSSLQIKAAGGLWPAAAAVAFAAAGVALALHFRAASSAPTRA